MEEEKIRLFVGGLAPEVTAGDLQERFAPLGNVEKITLPSAKVGGPGHRVFAYVDFVPATDASLRKLFNAYNGCKWRGGVLLIEKAKEHYIDKLHRELAIEAASSIMDPAANHVEVVEKSSLSSVWQPRVKGVEGDTEDSNLKIFFPKLKKLKSVSLTGLGKHKRSFPRVESSPLKLLVSCTCEESSRSGSCNFSNINGDNKGCESDEIAQAIGIERQRQLELLNRLFPSDSTAISLENQQVVELDDDQGKGILTHEGTVGSTEETFSKETLGLGKQKRSFQRVESTPPKLLISSAREERKLETNSKPVTTSNKDEDIPSTQLPDFQVVEGNKTSQQPTEAEKHTENRDNSSSAGQKLTRDAWKSLVGETGRVVFSLSQLTGSSLPPQAPSVIQETQVIEDAYTQVEPSVSSKASNPNQAKSKLAVRTSEKRHDGVKSSTKPNMNAAHLAYRPVTRIVFSDVCPFMRSENAEEEWLATRSQLRLDYKAKQKYAVRNVGKLWGKR